MRQVDKYIGKPKGSYSREEYYAAYELDTLHDKMGELKKELGLLEKELGYASEDVNAGFASSENITNHMARIAVELASNVERFRFYRHMANQYRNAHGEELNKAEKECRVCGQDEVNVDGLCRMCQSVKELNDAENGGAL